MLYHHGIPAFLKAGLLVLLGGEPAFFLFKARSPAKGRGPHEKQNPASDFSAKEVDTMVITRIYNNSCASVTDDKGQDMDCFYIITNKLKDRDYKITNEWLKK